MDLEDMDKVGRLNQKKTKDKANIVYSKDEEVIKEAYPTVRRDQEETTNSRKQSPTVWKGKAKAYFDDRSHDEMNLKNNRESKETELGTNRC